MQNLGQQTGNATDQTKTEKGVQKNGQTLKQSTGGKQELGKHENENIGKTPEYDEELEKAK